MKAIIVTLIGCLGTTALAQETKVPEALSLLPPEQLVKGATVRVVPPQELDTYIAKVEQAARANPEWFQEHSKKSAPGVPLPYDPKLGLTREEYDTYLELWGKREFKDVEPIVLRLRADGENEWIISTAGGAHQIATLKYDAANDVFLSPNGQLERIEDIKADKLSVLGEWTGREWKLIKETTLGITKENFALGQTGDEKFGLIVYRIQEATSAGTPLYDSSVVVRFPLGEEGLLKPEDINQKPKR